MKIESEKNLERKLGLLLKSLGGISLKLLSAHTTGLPDRICLLPDGRLFFAEMKTTGQKPRKIQTLMINRLRDLGFDVYVIDNTEQMKQILKDYE